MKLLFFTNSYPYGVGELWKTNELNVLIEYFEKITVIPFGYSNQKYPVDFINGVEYKLPLFPDGIPVSRWYSLTQYKFLFSQDIFLFLSEFWNKKVYMSKKKLIKWIYASYKMYLIKHNKYFSKILATVDENTMVYFYWGRETSEVIPILKLKAAKVFSRFHGYDLYRDRNEGYLPYQYQQLKKLDYAFPCSVHGRNSLIECYPDLADKIFVKRLGTISIGKANQTTSGPFIIVSCSFLEKVKRIDIIAKSLKFINADIHWIHIGDGTQQHSIEKITKEENVNNVVTFLGRLNNNEVIEFYKNSAIDLFVNVSESEGVPVSVMEAFSAAIPVFATNVGGTGEIVNNKNGKLLEKNITPIMLANEIEHYIQYSQKEKEKYRVNAFNTYIELCDANKLAHEFSSFILKKTSND